MSWSPALFAVSGMQFNMEPGVFLLKKNIQYKTTHALCLYVGIYPCAGLLVLYPPVVFCSSERICWVPPTALFSVPPMCKTVITLLLFFQDNIWVLGGIWCTQSAFVSFVVIKDFIFILQFLCLKFSFKNKESNISFYFLIPIGSG